MKNILTALLLITGTLHASAQQNELSSANKSLELGDRASAVTKIDEARALIVDAIKADLKASMPESAANHKKETRGYDVRTPEIKVSAGYLAKKAEGGDSKDGKKSKKLIMVTISDEVSKGDFILSAHEAPEKKTIPGNAFVAGTHKGMTKTGEGTVSSEVIVEGVAYILVDGMGYSDPKVVEEIAKKIDYDKIKAAFKAPKEESK